MTEPTVSVIPEGDRGQFRITDQMMFEADAVTMGAFEILIREEAQRRGLDLTILEEIETRDIIVRWEPADPSTHRADAEEA